MPKEPEYRRPAADNALAATVADRLKKLIAKNGRSFERLADLSGIDPKDLLGIERGAITPTINHLWRIAHALGIPFGSLVAAGTRDVRVIRSDQRHSVASHDGNFQTRPLFPYSGPRAAEFYEVVLAPHHRQSVEAHAPGTKENLVVSKGAVEVSIGREAPQTLEEGDAIDFLADVPHSYRNLGSVPAIVYLVMSYEPCPCDGSA
ncbi:helix-turn-helix domain-containing protein [Methylocystis parvus]|uniref:Helix-turn-helix domain-containing protein n=1 Tax=Methylocystis parvus TaxID=134 RepID=A0A6B8LZD1_9HYPH|nr:XRE family transcriptional regulator [Methylocystis parvus]QGM97787.1 helix-turn-helix domain-containing protein [Methylocystis parvus]WBK01906.1 XRE family transcriptional regulator [Methylocystis parvus OBBP]